MNLCFLNCFCICWLRVQVYRYSILSRRENFSRRIRWEWFGTICHGIPRARLFNFVMDIGAPPNPTPPQMPPNGMVHTAQYIQCTQHSTYSTVQYSACSTVHTVHYSVHNSTHGTVYTIHTVRFIQCLQCMQYTQ